MLARTHGVGKQRKQPRWPITAAAVRRNCDALGLPHPAELWPSWEGGGYPRGVLRANSATGGTLTWEAEGIQFDGSTEGIGIPDSPSLRPSSGITLVLQIKRHGTIGSVKRVFAKEWNNAASNPYVSWGFEGTTSDRLNWYTARSASASLNVLPFTFNPTLHKYVSLAGVYDSVAGSKVFIDGGSVASDPGITGDITYYTSSGGQVDIGAYNYGASLFAPIGIRIATLFDVALTQSAIDLLAKNPYALLAHRPAPIFFDVGAAPPATSVPVFMHHYQHQTLGSMR